MKNYYLDYLRANRRHLGELKSQISSEIAGRRCLIIGSAPNAIFPEFNNDYTICINGSVYSLRQQYNTHPDITFLNGHMFKKSDIYATKTLEVIENNNIGNIIIQSDLQQIVKTKLQSINTTFRTSFPVSKYDKRCIVGDVLGYNMLGSYNHLTNISSGMFAAALALWCGASTIIMIGFSLNSEHAYSSSTQLVKRRHVKEDAHFLSLLSSLNLPVSTTSEALANDFKITLHNTQ